MVALALVSISGCRSVGPEGVKKVHYEYNSAIAKTDDEQFLLNIVRLKYRDNLYFLEVSNIVENRKFTTRVGWGGSEIGLDKNSGKSSLSPLAYSEAFECPTVSYAPLKGEDFTRRMITPIPVNVVFGLMQLGCWGPELVFSLCVEQINNVDNASTASGPTPLKAPDYEKFSRVCELIRAMEEAKDIAWGLSSADQKNLAIRFAKNPSCKAEINEFKSILGLDLNKNVFEFSSAFWEMNNGGLTVRTRSLMEVLFFLSHAVSVPQSDIDSGIVTKTTTPDGTVFDWTKNLSGKWISIKSSEDEHRPENASVAIRYRSRWFYIEDNDLKSKSTFLFLHYLFNLMSGNHSAAAPTLIISAS